MYNVHHLAFSSAMTFLCSRMSSIVTVKSPILHDCLTVVTFATY
jgi:hypothetical protein